MSAARKQRRRRPKPAPGFERPDLSAFDQSVLDELVGVHLFEGHDCTPRMIAAALVGEERADLLVPKVSEALDRLRAKGLVQ